MLIPVPYDTSEVSSSYSVHINRTLHTLLILIRGLSQNALCEDINTRTREIPQRTRILRLVTVSRLTMRTLS